MFQKVMLLLEFCAYLTVCYLMLVNLMLILEEMDSVQL